MPSLEQPNCGAKSTRLARDATLIVNVITVLCSYHPLATERLWFAHSQFISFSAKSRMIARALSVSAAGASKSLRAWASPSAVAERSGRFCQVVWNRHGH
jgi:hypothetical protein